VLATSVRLGRLTRAQAHAAWLVGRSLVEDASVEPAAVLDAAFERGLSGYDAEFVAPAGRLRVPLVTDDRRVLTACPDVAVGLDAFGDEDDQTRPEATDP
jgi:predicted nucleic acid-binding protein